MGSAPPAPIAESVGALKDATARLQATVSAALDTGGPDPFAAPCLLPGWTIGHLVTHLARNADGMRRVLAGARVGEQLQPYASPRAREQDIIAGALRSTRSIALDFGSACDHLTEAIDELPAGTWSATVDLGLGGPTTADVVLTTRLAEVEIHHHDLGLDDGLALLDDAQTSRLLAALLRSYARTRNVPGLTLIPDRGAPAVIGDGAVEVSGSAIDLVGWLSGRTDGGALRTSGGLPELPPW